MTEANKIRHLFTDGYRCGVNVGEGAIYDYENCKFGTSEINSLYRVLPNKKDSEEPLKSFLVAGVGFEPTTFGL